MLVTSNRSKKYFFRHVGLTHLDISETFRNLRMEDCPTGDIIMNRTEHKWLTETFPQTPIRRIAPYAGGLRNQIQNIWRVGALLTPRSFNQAMSQNRLMWQEAMKKEYATQMANRTWTLVECSPNVKGFPMIWVYKHQVDAEGLQVGGKARLVVLGNKQIIELNEHNYAPVVNFVSILLLISFAVKHGFFIHHIDCNTAFLNADVDGEFYAYQPEGFKVKGKERLLCKLFKAIHGLRQSARRWYLKLRSVLLSFGFKQLLVDSCIHIKRFGDVLIIIAVYVDDLLAIANAESELARFKFDFSKIIKIKDHGTVSKFLGLEMKYDRLSRTMEFGQAEYIPHCDQGLINNFIL